MLRQLLNFKGLSVPGKKVQQRARWFQTQWDPCSTRGTQASLKAVCRDQLYQNAMRVQLLLLLTPCPSLCLITLAELRPQPKLSRPLTYFFTHDPYPMLFHRHLISFHNFKTLFACLCVVVSCNECGFPRHSASVFHLPKPPSVSSRETLWPGVKRK